MTQSEDKLNTNLMEINHKILKNPSIWFTVVLMMCIEQKIPMKGLGIYMKLAVAFMNQIHNYHNVSEYKKSTCKALSMMDLDKINYDLILELMEWIVDGEHQVRFIAKNFNQIWLKCAWL